MRTPLSVLGAAGLTALGGAILGEYTFNGWVAVVGAILFGVLVGEVVVVIGPRRTPIGLVAAGLFPPSGWIWGLWISTGHALGYATVIEWIGAALAGAAGLGWVVSAGWSRR